MNGPQLVHVVALVGTRTGIHEREHARNEQRRLVVRHGERTGKDGTRLTVLALAIAEEQGVRSRIVVPQLAGLPHKAARQHSTVVHMRTAGKDKVVADDSVTHSYRCRFVAVDAAVGQTTGARDAGIVADTDIPDRPRIQDGHMTADGAHRRSMFVGIIVRYLLQAGSQFGTMAVEGHNIGQVGRQLVINYDFTPARLVQNRHLHPIAKP